MSGKTFEVIDPTTEKVACNVSKGDAADIDRAVQAAKSAFALGSTWRRMDASERGRLLYCLADALVANLEYVSLLEALDAGKPVESARGEVQFAVNVIRYYAGFADKIHGQACCFQISPIDALAIKPIWSWSLKVLVHCLCVGSIRCHPSIQEVRRSCSLLKPCCFYI